MLWTYFVVPGAMIVVVAVVGVVVVGVWLVCIGLCGAFCGAVAQRLWEESTSLSPE